MAGKKDDATGPADRPRQFGRDFDAAAATWDDNPRRRQMSETIADAVRKAVPLQKTRRVLEYGCGTATLGFLLAPQVREVVAADASAGMIEQVRRKLDGSPATNLKPMLLDLEKQPAPPERFDLIVTAMAMHHVEGTERVLGRMGEMLTDDGWLAVADLCREDGSFHQDIVVPHNGFVPEELAETIARSIPRARCQWKTIHTVTKNDRQYDIFLLVAGRAAS